MEYGDTRLGSNRRSTSQGFKNKGLFNHEFMFLCESLGHLYVGS